jgi:hypothetical protein
VGKPQSCNQQLYHHTQRDDMTAKARRTILIAALAVTFLLTTACINLDPPMDGASYAATKAWKDLNNGRATAVANGSAEPLYPTPDLTK